MGKLSAEELKKLLGCIKSDSRIVVPPQVGFDAGVHRVGDKYLAVATDPCVGVPEDWFGFLLVNYAASDMALFGAKPEFCTITLMGPRTTQPQKFQKVMKQVCKAASDLDMAIVRGHTGTYDGITELVGVCTAYGTVDLEKLKTPAKAKPEDVILCTKPIGQETAVNYALTHQAAAQKLFGMESAANLATLVHFQSCVKEALQLAQLEGVHAMHDATEGGFISAMNELAEASKLGFRIEFEKLPVQCEARILQEEFKLSDEQTLAMSSTGTILAAVDPKAKQAVEEILAKNGLQACFIGEFTKDKKRVLLKGRKKAGFPETAEDPYSVIFSGKA
jgi:hydrogenase expression/formation protein HypE